MMPLDSLTAVYALLASLIAAIDEDAINGTFELSAGFFVLNHCRVLREHQEVRGVSMLSIGFFTLWGLWNPYYYSALQQPLSFYGGLFVVAANALYLSMIVHYRRLVVLQDEHAIYLGIESSATDREL
ncbi:MAG: hypothetical protein WC742_12415 [Gallionellaceae bacterium]